LYFTLAKIRGSNLAGFDIFSRLMVGQRNGLVFDKMWIPVDRK
jgi:hypothetical protein